MIERRSSIVDGLLIHILIAVYQRMKILFLFQIQMWIKNNRYYSIAIGAHATSHKHSDALHHTNACTTYAEYKYFWGLL